MMEVRATVFKDLVELYPKTKERIKQISLEKHDIIVNYLKKHEKLKKLRLASEAELESSGTLNLSLKKNSS